MYHKVTSTGGIIISSSGSSSTWFSYPAFSPPSPSSPSSSSFLTGITLTGYGFFSTFGGCFGSLFLSSLGLATVPYYLALVTLSANISANIMSGSSYFTI